MLTDPDTLYKALCARDPRFDGLAFACVKTTGIFCRMTCPAGPARRENVSFRASTGECVAEGYRPCKRCKPMGA